MINKNALVDNCKKNVTKIIVIPMIVFLVFSYCNEKFEIQEQLDFGQEYCKDFIANYPMEWSIIIFIFVVALIKNIRAFRGFISKKYNKFDTLVIQAMIVSVLMFYRYQNIKIFYVTGITLLFFVARIVIRIIKNDNKNTVFLSDVYDNTIKDKTQNRSIYIKEALPNVDLLDRTYEVNLLRDSIIDCYPEKAFFIGLDGKWNTGKSSIVNFCKDEIKQNGILVVDFDPCKYENCEAMLAGFYDEIAKCLNIYNKITYRKALKFLIENISIEKTYRFNIKNALLELIPNRDINQMICNELEMIDKRLLIIVDNLDRADKDIMNFFIKCTYAVTDFRNTIFLLIYDSHLLNKQLVEIHKTDNLFMKKIINLPIKMPETNTVKINNIFKQSLKNLVEHGYVPEESYSEYKYIDYFDDLRDVIRTLNYVISHSDVIRELNLDVYDLIGIKWISENDPELYNEIRKSKAILTYSSTDFMSNIESKNRENAENELRKLYKMAKNNLSKSILGDLFSNVYLVNSMGYINIHGKKQNNCNRIEDINYFEMYFYINESDYFFCKKKMEKLSSELTKCDEVKIYEKEILEQVLKDINKNVYCQEVLSEIIKESPKQHKTYLYYLACKNIIKRKKSYIFD